MPRVVHFEIPAADTARAVEFYRKVFDWKIETWQGPMKYFLADTGKEGPGINGAIMGNDGTAKTTVNTIGVASVDEFIAKIKKAGGKQVTEKNEIPKVGYFCYCQDTEGNLFGILEPFPGSMQPG
jgi:predicted enzyme related to lactoylglutathione lyase